MLGIYTRKCKRTLALFKVLEVVSDFVVIDFLLLLFVYQSSKEPKFFYIFLCIYPAYTNKKNLKPKYSTHST